VVASIIVWIFARSCVNKIQVFQVPIPDNEVSKVKRIYLMPCPNHIMLCGMVEGWDDAVDYIIVDTCQLFIFPGWKLREKKRISPAIETDIPEQIHQVWIREQPPKCLKPIESPFNASHLRSARRWGRSGAGLRHIFHCFVEKSSARNRTCLWKLHNDKVSSKVSLSGGISLVLTYWEQYCWMSIILQ